MSKIKPVGLMLYKNECGDMFTTDDYTDEELGTIMRIGWLYFDETITREEAVSMAKDRSMRIAIRSICKSVDTSKAQYDKRVDEAGIGGITGKLIKMDGWTLKRVHEHIEKAKADGYTDAEILSELKTIYADAIKVKKLSQPQQPQPTHSNEDRNGWINGLPAERYKGL